MQFQPVRAIIKRDGDKDIAGILPVEPTIGGALQLFLDSGKVMRTSTVKHVARHGSELVVDTVNSRYRVVELGPATE